MPRASGRRARPRPPRRWPPSRRRRASQPEQQHAGGYPAHAEHELAEVLVDGDEDAAVLVGAAEHLVVANAGGQLRHVVHVVALVAEPLDDPGFNALVRQQPHATGVEIG